jgi:predicted ATP-dependent protease
MNQKGEIQPIGGVNEKIEGMFDICSLFGLTGSQGVIIPHQNVKNLMLREDVVEAIRSEKFHVYAIKTVDEGIEILTGRKAGDKITCGIKKGQYIKDTVNFFVDKRLKELSSRPK